MEPFHFHDFAYVKFFSLSMFCDFTRMSAFHIPSEHNRLPQLQKNRMNLRHVNLNPYGSHILTDKDSSNTVRLNQIRNPYDSATAGIIVLI